MTVAYKKPKGSKTPSTKQPHSPADSATQLSAEKPCDFCDPGLCNSSCAGSDIIIPNLICPRVRESIGDVGKACMRSVGSADSKSSKGGKKGKKGGGKKGSPPASPGPSSTGPSPAGSPPTQSYASGGPLCTVMIYKWNLCEVVLAAIVVALVLVVLREACKIMCSRSRRRRRSC